MQEFTIFDIVIISITILLGLKGLFRGFIKEIFGLIGIIGGIFIASRLSEDIGNLIAPVLSLENNATIKLIGFVATLVIFWVIIYIIGNIISKVFSVSGLGFVDRLLGFCFGAAKIFLIFSVIVYAIYQIQSFRSLIEKKISTSVTLPFLVSTGSFIVKLDPNDFITINKNPDEKKPISQRVNETVNSLKEDTINSTDNLINAVKKMSNDMQNTQNKDSNSKIDEKESQNNDTPQ